MFRNRQNQSLYRCRQAPLTQGTLTELPSAKQDVFYQSPPNRTARRLLRTLGLLVCAAVLMLLLAAAGLYQMGYLGVTHDQIMEKQWDAIPWEMRSEYRGIGAGREDCAIYVEIIYKKGASDATYGVYLNKSGWEHGWRLLQGGTLTEADGLLEFDCGRYGRAYVSLHVDDPMIEISKDAIQFYDKDGNVIEPTVIQVVD